MKNKGFTLIELMVTIAIIGILAAIAYPAYMDSMRKGKLAEIKSALLVAGTRLEKSNIANNAFPEAGTGSGQFDVANIENSTKYTYNYSRAASDTQNFVLTGKETKIRVWAGINSNGARCACFNCDTASATITTAATTCSSPTESF